MKVRMVARVQRTCLMCGGEFSPREAEVKRGGGKYCGVECSWEASKKTVERIPNTHCAWCGKPLWRKPSRLNSKRGLHFCSRSHLNLAKRLDGGLVELLPDHYGTASAVPLLEVKPCAHCGKHLSMSKRRKFCSQSCVNEVRRAKAVETRSLKQTYRRLSAFNFALNAYPDAFDFDLVEEFGWYSPSNRGGNLGGVSRDHLLSVMDGFTQRINPSILSHPANCALKTQQDNFAKRQKSDLDLNQLLVRIQTWNVKYGESFSVDKTHITDVELRRAFVKNTGM